MLRSEGMEESIRLTGGTAPAAIYKPTEGSPVQTCAVVQN
jgi:hypothetical protein